MAILLHFVLIAKIVFIYKHCLRKYQGACFLETCLPYFSADNSDFYYSDMDSKFLVRIIRGYSKFEVRFCRCNKDMMKLFHERAKIWC